MPRERHVNPEMQLCKLKCAALYARCNRERIRKGTRQIAKLRVCVCGALGGYIGPGRISGVYMFLLYSLWCVQSDEKRAGYICTMYIHLELRLYDLFFLTTLKTTSIFVSIICTHNFTSFKEFTTLKKKTRKKKNSTPAHKG